MHEDDGRVVSNFILQALRGDDITIYGDGSQTRSFQYVSDLIDGFIRLLATETDPGPVNLGNPSERTIHQLAEMVIHMTDSSSKLCWEPLPVDDPTRRCPDITKANAILGWEPKISMEDGLAKTISYFKNCLAINSSAIS
jgi:UDP-glucuronate decarboxylase